MKFVYIVGISLKIGIVIAIIGIPSENVMMIKTVDAAIKIVRENFDLSRETMVLSRGLSLFACNEFLRNYNGQFVLSVHAYTALPKQVVIFTRVVNDFFQILSELKPNLKGKDLLDPTAMFLIVLTSDSGNVARVSEAMWRTYATDVIIVSAAGGRVALHTYWPYRRGVCGDSAPDLLALWDGTTPAAWGALYPDKMKSLHGCPLSISTVNPFHSLGADKIPIEAVKTKLAGLLRRAMDFTPVRVAARAEDGGAGGANWTGSLDDVLRGRANLSLSSALPGAELARVLDLSVPYYYLDVSWVAPPVSVAPAWWRLLAPLGVALWAALVATVALVFGFPAAAARVPRVRRFCRRYFKRIGRVRGAAFRTWGVLLGQPVRVRPRRFRDAYAVTLWVWFAFTVRSAYQSSLIGALKSETPLGNFESLAEATAAGYRHGGKRDVAAHFDGEPEVTAAWVEVPDAKFDALFERMIRGKERFVTAASLEYVWAACAGAGSSLRACVHVLPEPILTMPLVVYLRRRSPLTRSVDAWLARLHESGLLAAAAPSTPPAAAALAPLPSDPEPLTLQQVAGCFICLLFGSCCSLLVFVAERIAHKLKWQRLVLSFRFFRA